MKITEQKLRQIIRKELIEARRPADTFMGKTEDEWVDAFIDDWEKERAVDPTLDQPDYDDVDGWSPSTWVTSVVWSALKQMRNI